MSEELINVTLDNALKESSILALLEEYGKWAFVHKQANKDEIKEMIMNIISTAMDRGDASQATIDHMEKWLAKYEIDTDFVVKTKCIEKFMEHALVEELEEVVEDQASLPEALKQAIAARKEYKQLLSKLFVNYSARVKLHTKSFCMSYEKLFDTTFFSILPIE